jgi:hypothetical protein
MKGRSYAALQVRVTPLTDQESRRQHVWRKFRRRSGHGEYRHRTILDELTPTAGTTVAHLSGVVAKRKHQFQASICNFFVIWRRTPVASLIRRDQRFKVGRISRTHGNLRCPAGPVSSRQQLSFFAAFLSPAVMGLLPCRLPRQCEGKRLRSCSMLGDIAKNHAP